MALASSAQAFSEVQCAVKGGGGTGRPCCPSAAHSGWCCISSQGSLAQLSPLALTHCPDSVLALLSLLAPPTLFHMFPQVPVDGVSGNRASGRSPPFWAAASHVVEHRPVGSLAWGCLLSTQLQRAFRHLTDIHVTKRCHRGRQRAQVCLKVSAVAYRDELSSPASTTVVHSVFQRHYSTSVHGWLSQFLSLHPESLTAFKGTLPLTWSCFVFLMLVTSRLERNIGFKFLNFSL